MLSNELTDITPSPSQGIPVIPKRRSLDTGCNDSSGKVISAGSKIRRILSASSVEMNGIERKGRNHSAVEMKDKKKSLSSCAMPFSTPASATSLLRLVLEVLQRVPGEQNGITTVPPRPPNGSPKHNGRHRRVYSSISYEEPKAKVLSKEDRYSGIGNTIQTRSGLSTTGVVFPSTNKVYPYNFISQGENVENTCSPLNHVSVMPHTQLSGSLGEKVSNSRVVSLSSSVICTPPAAAAAAASDVKVPKEVLKESLPQGICEEPLIGLLLDACTDENGTIALADVLSFLASKEDNTEDSVHLKNKLSMTDSEATLKAYFRVFILIGARQYPVDDKMRIITVVPSSQGTLRKKRRTVVDETEKERTENTSINADSPWLLLAEQLFQYLSSFPRNLLYHTGPLGEERTAPKEWGDRWDSWSTSPSALQQLPILQVWPLIMFPRFVVLMTRWGRRPMDVLREVQMSSAYSQNGSILSLAATTTGGSLFTDESHGCSVSSHHPYYEEDGDIMGKQRSSGDSSNDSNNEKNDVVVNSDTTRVRIRGNTRESVHRINYILNTWENEFMHDTVRVRSAHSHYSSENSSLRSQYWSKTTLVQPPSKKKKIKRYRDGKTEKQPLVGVRAWYEEFSPYAGSTLRTSTYPFIMTDTNNNTEMREKRWSGVNGRVNHHYRKKEKNCFFATRLHSAVKSGQQIGKDSEGNSHLNVGSSESSRVSFHIRPNSRLSLFSSTQVFPSTTELSDLACDVLKRAHGQRHLVQVKTPENQKQQEEQQEQQKKQEGKEERKQRYHHHHNSNQETSLRSEVSSLVSSLPINKAVSACLRESEESDCVKPPNEIPTSNIMVEITKETMQETLPHSLEESKKDDNPTLYSKDSIKSLKKKEEDIPFTLTQDTLTSPSNLDMAICLQRNNSEVPSELCLSRDSSTLCPSTTMEAAVRNNNNIHYHHQEEQEEEEELKAPMDDVNRYNIPLSMKENEDNCNNGPLVGIRRVAAEILYQRLMGFKARRDLGRQRALRKSKSLISMVSVEPPPLPNYTREESISTTTMGTSNSETATFRELTWTLLEQMNRCDQCTHSTVKKHRRKGYLNIILLLQRLGRAYISRKIFINMNSMEEKMKPPATTEEGSPIYTQMDEPSLLKENTFLKNSPVSFPTDITPIDIPFATTTSTTTTTTPTNSAYRQRSSGVTFLAYGENIHREIKNESRESSAETPIKCRDTPPDFWHGRITRQVDYQKQLQLQSQEQQEQKKEEHTPKTTEHLITKRTKTPVGSPLGKKSGFNTAQVEVSTVQEKNETSSPNTRFLLALDVEGTREVQLSNSISPSEMLLTNTEGDESNLVDTLSGAQYSGSNFSLAQSCCFSICSTHSVHSVSPGTPVLNDLDDTFLFEKDEEKEEDDLKTFDDSLSCSSEELQNEKTVNATMDYVVPTVLTDQPAMGESEASLLIQRVGRGFADRRQLHFSLLVNVSSFEICIIHRAVAGYYQRKQLGYRYHAAVEAEKELQWFHYRNRSAVQIQRMIRGFLARQRTKKLQRKLWVRIELHVAREQHEIYEEF
ncbi:proteophosphoglycan ppg4 [Trypanosoma theileri]|uniref:Proteophosphoglycan ppg4 n=1 Tax=Trypanosoma theileri TaxID=67003 RepID=A0A1X0P1Z7_9TRYP|nr:proteophosphoglycan ppg4 [Trypanosoma theileri]ORC90964.1 proteophosphoglycan ppg4 [Trypanosoma theileri]